MSGFSRAEMAGHIANVVLSDKPLRLRKMACFECGGEIVADVADPGPQVLRHNQTYAHLRACRHDRPEELGREE